jgi:UDP-N-acetylmuramyl pentapeptide synthase
MAREIYQMSSSAIEGVLINKISEALSNSLKSREDIEKKKFEITSNIISRFH